MPKFTLDEQEHLYLQGYASYRQTKLKVYDGDAIITSNRFVFCKKMLF
jgi:hypothetical protein